MRPFERRSDVCYYCKAQQASNWRLYEEPWLQMRIAFPSRPFHCHSLCTPSYATIVSLFLSLFYTWKSSSLTLKTKMCYGICSISFYVSYRVDNTFRMTKLLSLNGLPLLNRLYMNHNGYHDNHVFLSWLLTISYNLDTFWERSSLLMFLLTFFLQVVIGVNMRLYGNLKHEIYSLLLSTLPIRPL